MVGGLVGDLRALGARHLADWLQELKRLVRTLEHTVVGKAERRQGRGRASQRARLVHGDHQLVPCLLSLAVTRDPELVISRRSVGSHLARIYRKLDIRSRIQLAATAAVRHV